MAGVTNDLVEKSKAISSNFSNEEYDVLLSSGEQVTGTLSACLIDKGIKARSMLGWQILLKLKVSIKIVELYL